MSLPTRYERYVPQETPTLLYKPMSYAEATRSNLRASEAIFYRCRAELS